MKKITNSIKHHLVIYLGVFLISSMNLNAAPTYLLLEAAPILEIVKQKKELKKEKKFDKKLERKTKKLNRKLKKLDREKSTKRKGIIILWIGVFFLLIGLLLFLPVLGVGTIGGCLEIIFGIAFLVGGLVMAIIGIVLSSS